MPRSVEVLRQLAEPDPDSSPISRMVFFEIALKTTLQADGGDNQTLPLAEVDGWLAAVTEAHHIFGGEEPFAAVRVRPGVFTMIDLDEFNDTLPMFAGLASACYAKGSHGEVADIPGIWRTYFQTSREHATVEAAGNLLEVAQVNMTAEGFLFSLNVTA